jgi:hypothetical protein
MMTGESLSATPNGTNQRDALIYIPGIANSQEQDFEIVAQKIAAALDKNTQTIEASFNIKVNNEDFGQNFKTKVCTIVRQDLNGTRSIIDIYELNYSQKLTQKYDKRNLFTKSFLLGAILLSNIPRFIRGLFKAKESGKALKHKLQILYGLILLFSLSIYALTLILALFQVLKDIPHFPEAFKELFNHFPFYNIFKKLPKLATDIIVILTALGFLTPEVKTSFEKAAVNYLCSLNYLNLGSSRSLLSGQLTELLEHILEKEDIKYRQLHILAYSFGSLLALDTLFPINRLPMERFRKIDALITIGCPFDMVRTFWSSYFENRQALAGIPKRWLNVYSPIDAFASNFRNDDKLEPADHTIKLRDTLSAQSTKLTPPKPENIPYLEGETASSVLDWLTLIGLRSHGGYWEGKDDSEISCFYDVMSKMYEGDSLLR